MIKERNGKESNAIINPNFRIVFNSMGEDQILVEEDYKDNFNDNGNIFLKLGGKFVNFTIIFSFHVFYTYFASTHF